MDRSPDRARKPLPESLKDGNDWEKSRWYPATGSIASVDLDWGASISEEWDGNPIRESLDITQALFQAGIDHLGGAALLIGASTLVVSPNAAACAALEALATAAFIMDIKATKEDRLRRATNFRLTELEESRRILDTEEPRRQITAILKAASETGYKLNKWTEGRNIPFLQNESGQKDAINWIMDSVLEDRIGIGFYRNMSTSVHSQDRSTISMMEMFERADDQYARNVHVALLSGRRGTDRTKGSHVGLLGLGVRFGQTRREPRGHLDSRRWSCRWLHPRPSAWRGTVILNSGATRIYGGAHYG